MKQILQNLKTGKTELAEIPVPSVRKGCLLIKTSKSLISLGTERMLLNFGKANLIDKALQQPDKVRQTLQKAKNDGIAPTINAVLNKLEQPLPLGYSNAGVVLEVGEGVYGVKPGDRVVSNGYHAEVVCVGANLCAKIPDNVDDTSASFVVVSSIALEGIRLVNPTLGESVAVIGLGLVGLLTAQILLANGCRVIGFDYDSAKVKLAESYGVEAHDLSVGINPVVAAMTFSRQNGVDAVIITASTTSNDPIRQAPQMCRKRGRVVLVGVVGLEMSRDDFYKKEISFTVSCSYGPGRYAKEYEEKGLDYPIGYVRWTEQRNFEAVLDLMARNKLCVEKLVSKEIDFDDAEQAYELVSSASDILGLVLKYNKPVDLTQKSVILKPMPDYAFNDAGRAVIGFIGAGNYASGILVPAFAETNAVLKTIASSGGVSGNHVGKKFGFSVATTDYNRILNDPEINTVVIATGHSSHARLIAEALNNQKHVFCEKPAALTEDEIELIKTSYEKSIAANKRLHLMIGYNRRFSPIIKAAKENLKTETNPCAIIITVNAGAIPDEHWVHDAEAGGGRVVGECCHFIDLIRHLTQSPIESVDSTYMNASGDSRNPPDTASISVKCKNGSIGTVHYFANGSKEFPKERIEIFCAGKIMQIDNFKSLTHFGWKKAKNISLWSQDKGQKACVKEFVEAVENGSQTPIGIDEILEVARFTLKAGK
ncbi:MAG: bi-domain-containing oxidoreductase [Candidatus Riflebacteria bacterium]|nr:bi-domain-containing oxidoreductase [Candidatus Riflebacteria bacterium]